VAEFETNIDRVNAIAARSPGFVWLMTGDQMQAAQTDPVGILGANPRMASTLSVWESAGHLDDFVHKTVHSHFMDLRDTSHTKQVGPAYVIWPVAKGHTPSLNEAIERLEKLGVEGPTDEAFDFNWLRSRAAPAKV